MTGCLLNCFLTLDTPVTWQGALGIELFPFDFACNEEHSFNMDPREAQGKGIRLYL